MYLNHDYKLMFIHVPKTGGMTVRHYLKRNHVQNHNELKRVRKGDLKKVRRKELNPANVLGLENSPKRFIIPAQRILNEYANKNRFNFAHMSAITARELHKEVFNEYFKFGVVRNPYERFVAAVYYKYHTFTEKNDLDNALINYSLEKTRQYIKERFIPHYFAKDRAKPAAFEHYAPVIAPQYLFLCDKDKNIIVDRICSIKNLDTEIKNIMQKLSIPIKYNKWFKRRNASPGPTQFNKMDVLDEELKEAVFNFYKEDFKIFNFSEKYSKP